MYYICLAGYIKVHWCSESRMSKMKLDRKPPLAKSPILGRPNRVSRSSSRIIQNPQGSLSKSQVAKRIWSTEETESRRKYLSISSEFEALAKMVQNGFGEEDDKLDGEAAVKKSPLFERGRFYEAYSARRNERLKRKKGEDDEVLDRKKASASAYGLGVNVESTKRRESKKLESGRKSFSLSAYAIADRSEHPRYSLRSIKENKKPPLYAEMPSAAAHGERSVATRRVRRM